MTNNQEKNNLDSRLQSMVTKFIGGHGLDSRDEDEQFEAFVAHLVIRRFHQEYHERPDIADVENFLVGGTDDAGLDAIGIFINGLAVHTEADVDRIAKANRHIQAQFVFVQAKRSASFDSAGIVKFTRGAHWFLRSALDVEHTSDLDISRYNEKVQDRVRLAGHVYRHCGDKMSKDPECFLYYASTGVWDSKGDFEPARHFEDGRLDLERSFNLPVAAIPFGRDDLRTIYRHLERAVEKRLTFHEVATIPATPQVDEAYIGVVTGSEFVQLLSTDNGDLDRRLFYDNVRDYQGDNEINVAIAKTLTEAGASFPFLNNGVTIVAHDASRIKGSSRGFNIQDFQIVNGCQTSYVLFNNRAIIDDQTFVPVKLIVTTERDLVTEIIRGTNSQTPIKVTDLHLLTQFHVELEDFYKAEELKRQPDVDEANRVHYERRSGQYRYTRVEQKSIVTSSIQTSAMVAMFLDHPERYRDGLEGLFEAFGDKLYQMADPKRQHQLHPYYASGLAALMLDRWRLTQEDRSQISLFQAHVLMRLRVSIAGDKMPPLWGRKMEEYCSKIVNTINDEQRWADACHSAFKEVQNQWEQMQRERDGRPLKIRGLSREVKEAREFAERLGGRPQAHAATDIRRRGTPGTILSFNHSRYSGRIKTENDEIVAVYGEDLAGAAPPQQWRPGARVWFKVGEDTGPTATAGMKKATEISFGPEIDE